MLYTQAKAIADARRLVWQYILLLSFFFLINGIWEGIFWGGSRTYEINFEMESLEVSTCM